jgi:hypothetical protein
MMDCGEGYPQPWSCKHHHHILGVRQFLKKFRMTGEGKSILLKVCFVNGTGADRLNLTIEGKASGLFDMAWQVVEEGCP